MPVLGKLNQHVDPGFPGAVRPRPCNGGLGAVETLMSPLSLIKARIQRQQRLNDAQLLMAKAYRGVEYKSATVGVSNDAPKSCTYRGIPYNC